ncbi:MAG TPA: 50S ribosomal protein L25 [Candidatus Saccharibacteria bacterium]|nr:50S ribosomal protein L25 [Candidatus Saccharibacteria bacterium]
MGDKINLTLQPRELQGKKVARLRKEGIVPGVVYGQGIDPIIVQSPYREIEVAVRDAGKHAPVQLTVDGKKKIAMIKDVDRDPVKARIRHVAFHAVKANEVVTAEVPIRLIGEGESEAERAGLVVLQAIEQIEVKARPAELPEALEVSLASLVTTEDKLTLADITLPRGVEFADAELDHELVVANVYEPAALQAANDAAGGDAEEASAEDVPAENGEDVPAAEKAE